MGEKDTWTAPRAWGCSHLPHCKFISHRYNKLCPGNFDESLSACLDPFSGLVPKRHAQGPPLSSPSCALCDNRDDKWSPTGAGSFRQGHVASGHCPQAARVGPTAPPRCDAVQQSGGSPPTRPAGVPSRGGRRPSQARLGGQRPKRPGVGGGGRVAGLSPGRRTGAWPAGRPRSWSARAPPAALRSDGRTDRRLTAAAAAPRAPAPRTRPGSAAHLARDLVQRVVLRRQPLPVGEPLAPRALGAHVHRARPAAARARGSRRARPARPGRSRALAPPSNAASWRQRAGDAGTRGQGLGGARGGGGEQRGPGTRGGGEPGARGRQGLGARGRLGTTSKEMAGGRFGMAGGRDRVGPEDWSARRNRTAGPAAGTRWRKGASVLVRLPGNPSSSQYTSPGGGQAGSGFRHFKNNSKCHLLQGATLIAPS